MSASPVLDTISMGGPPQPATGRRDLSISDANKSYNTISENNNANNINNEVLSLFDSLNSSNSIINNNKNHTHTHYSHTGDSDDNLHNNGNNNNHKDNTKQKHKKKSGSNNFGQRKNNGIEKKKPQLKCRTLDQNKRPTLQVELSTNRCGKVLDS